MYTDILIIGAGPTGLMAANQLNRFGMDFIILDQKEGPTIQSRAIAVTPRSMEIYQQMDLADKILQQCGTIHSVNIYVDGRKKAEAVLGEAGYGESDFPGLITFEQSKNETLLYENLRSGGKEVLWKTELLEIMGQNDQVIAKVRDNEKTFEIKAKYLIACDGAKSLVRKQLNFKFEGGTYQHKFFVADAALNWKLPHNQLVLSPSDKGFCAFFPMAGPKNYRVVGTLSDKFDESNEEEISVGDIEEAVRGIFNNEISFESVNWISVYHLHHRCVDKFSEGRIFLAGDSAHVHSPAGGQGMNTGLQDAYNLAWKLAFVLKGYARPELLNTYNEERLPFAKWLIGFTDRGFSVMTSYNSLIAFLRKNILLKIAATGLRIKKVRKRLFKTLSQFWYSYHHKSLSFSASRQSIKFKAGDRLPYLGPGFYKDFKAPSYHILHISDSVLPEDIHSAFSFPVKIIHQNLSEEWKAKGIKKEIFILVRPDNYIAYIFDKFDKEEIKKYLQRYFL